MSMLISMILSTGMSMIMIMSMTMILILSMIISMILITGMNGIIIMARSGHISGGHLNPAVSLGLAAAGKVNLYFYSSCFSNTFSYSACFPSTLSSPPGGLCEGPPLHGRPVLRCHSGLGGSLDFHCAGGTPPPQTCHTYCCSCFCYSCFCHPTPVIPDIFTTAPVPPAPTFPQVFRHTELRGAAGLGATLPNPELSLAQV